jgi:hypothetical protein
VKVSMRVVSGATAASLIGASTVFEHGVTPAFDEELGAASDGPEASADRASDARTACAREAPSATGLRRRPLC